MAIQVSIGEVKRDISELVNRVAYQGERVVLTSRGRPKAALVSMEDYARLQQPDQGTDRMAAWLAQAQTLAERIRRHHGGQDFDVDALIDTARGDRDAGDDD